MAQTKVKTKGITDTNVTNAKLGTDISAAKLTAGTVATARLGSGTASSSTYLAGDQTYKALSEYDDNQLQSNVAMLGFKVAVNGSLTRYNLVDQSIDEFYDTSGIDASASTNEARVASGDNYYYWGASGSNPSGGNSTDTSIADYTTHVFTADGALTVSTGGNVTILVVAGAGSGGDGYGGGGGAGGLIYKATHAITPNTYDAVIGDGGASRTGDEGYDGDDSTWTINGGAVEFTAKGGGGGGIGGSIGRTGGSAGGNGYSTSTAAAETQTGQAGDSGTYGFGNAGGVGVGHPNYNPGGGGGAGAVGGAGIAGASGAGGIGKDYSTIFGTAVGASGWFAGGGGATFSPDGSGAVGAGGTGGGGQGAINFSSNGTAGTANTGGGGGGSGLASGAGGKGVILVRYADDAFQAIDDLTLQSTDVTAGTAPTYGEFVTLIENAYGTATLNTDIKGYISRDSGTTFTQGTLVDEGTWGTNKKVLGFHDLDISSQPSGTSMCYKITTHNQSASSKETRVYATSIGWR